MNEQVLMRGDYDCGRVCLSNAVQITYETASKYLPGLEGDGAKANARDSMVHHKIALWRLHQPSRIVDDDMILRGECQPFKTCVLVHNPKRPTLIQHWVNFAGRTNAGDVVLWWNQPEKPIRIVSPQEFKDLYRRGSFNHAHEVGVGNVRIPSWWERFWYWFTVKI